MDEPLGRTADNAPEVAECVDVLHGGGLEDLVELTLTLGSRLVGATREQQRCRLSDGSAWDKFVAMVEVQGGDVSSLERMREVRRAPVVTDVPAPHAGRLHQLDALEIGRLCVGLGAGRAKAGEAIDSAVGVECLHKQGEQVASGEPVLRVHSREPVDSAGIAARVFDVR
jgi:thymidine phosphorylase